MSNIYSLVLMNCIKVFAAYDSSVWSTWSHLCLDENFYLFSYLFIYNRFLLRSLFLKKIDWHLVDLQCVSFRCIGKRIYYTYLHFLKESFSVCHEHRGACIIFLVICILIDTSHTLSFRKECLSLAFGIFRSKDQVWTCLLQQTCGALGSCFGSFSPFFHF